MFLTSREESFDPQEHWRLSLSRCVPSVNDAKRYSIRHVLDDSFFACLSILLDPENFCWELISALLKEMGFAYML